ncbi:MAG TPA: RcpC/CpaB family pilus assembly protein [Acidimicrobiales bacterium]|nr:RcpC/CpaB family pilus assembly protein [Acidimicrobiales bacterium]
MKKLNVAIVAGVVAALLGGALVLAYGRNVDDKIAKGREMTPVLVATEALAAGTAGASLRGSTELREMPKAFIATGALTSLDDVDAMTLLAPVPSGAQITRSSFGRPSEVGALKPSPGNVALAVGVDLVPGVARYITAPSMVDLFVTYSGGGGSAVAVPGQPAPTPGLAAARTKLFASGIKVMSVSVAPRPEERNTAGEVTTPIGDQVIAVLDVDPVQAERIVNSSTLGTLYLGLSGGETHTTPAGATPDDVVKSNR